MAHPCLSLAEREGARTIRVKSSNVPPEVWARDVRGSGAPNEKDKVLLNAWENSRQIYRFSEALWNVVDWDCGRDCSAAGLALKHLPYSCVFVQREESFKVSVNSLGNQGGLRRLLVLRFL